jgi:hypothetical protein
MTDEHLRPRILRVDAVTEHPNADKLNLVTVNGNDLVCNKVDGVKPRYSEGELVLFFPVGARVPEQLLRMGYWDDEKNQGILSGRDHDVVGSVTIRGVESRGVIFPVRLEHMINARAYVGESDVLIDEVEIENDPLGRFDFEHLFVGSEPEELD